MDAQGLLFLSALPQPPNPSLFVQSVRVETPLFHLPHFITCSVSWMAKLPAGSGQTFPALALTLG